MQVGFQNELGTSREQSQSWDQAEKHIKVAYDINLIIEMCVINVISKASKVIKHGKVLEVLSSVSSFAILLQMLVASQSGIPYIICVYTVYLCMPHYLVYIGVIAGRVFRFTRRRPNMCSTGESCWMWLQRSKPPGPVSYSNAPDLKIQKLGLIIRFLDQRRDAMIN